MVTDHVINKHHQVDQLAAACNRDGQCGARWLRANRLLDRATFDDHIVVCDSYELIAHAHAGTRRTAAGLDVEHDASCIDHEAKHGCRIRAGDGRPGWHGIPNGGRW